MEPCGAAINIDSSQHSTPTMDYTTITPQNFVFPFTKCILKAKIIKDHLKRRKGDALKDVSSDPKQNHRLGEMRLDLAFSPWHGAVGS
jgi:hypothetical protein